MRFPLFALLFPSSGLFGFLLQRLLTIREENSRSCDLFVCLGNWAQECANDIVLCVTLLPCKADVLESWSAGRVRRARGRKAQSFLGRSHGVVLELAVDEESKRASVLAASSGLVTAAYACPIARALLPSQARYLRAYAAASAACVTAIQQKNTQLDENGYDT